MKEKNEIKEELDLIEKKEKDQNKKQLKGKKEMKNGDLKEKIGKNRLKKKEKENQKKKEEDVKKKKEDVNQKKKEEENKKRKKGKELRKKEREDQKKKKEEEKKKKGAFNELQKLQQENNQILEFLGFDRKFFIENNENINELNNNKIIGGNQIIENDDFNFQEINPVKKAFGDVGYNENIVNDKEIYQEKSIRKNNYVEIVVKNREKKKRKN